ncbi:hypothetical protein [Nonomuraea indica]|uniref:hypothetical protein n=1 Tax=Nonomuraea indica TaxID=1581193 RepID=UPI000C7AC21C|nr:hypothetical protein [Nonomuraea indica]
MTGHDSHADRIVDAVAAHAADHLMLPGGDLLVGAVRTALLVARIDIPVDDIPAEADRRIAKAARAAMATEYEEVPA